MQDHAPDPDEDRLIHALSHPHGGGGGGGGGTAPSTQTERGGKRRWSCQALQTDPETSVLAEKSIAFDEGEDADSSTRRYSLFCDGGGRGQSREGYGKKMHRGWEILHLGGTFSRKGDGTYLHVRKGFPVVHKHPSLGRALTNSRRQQRE